jgi:hypothetical protein
MLHVEKKKIAATLRTIQNTCTLCGQKEEFLDIKASGTYYTLNFVISRVKLCSEISIWKVNIPSRLQIDTFQQEQNLLRDIQNLLKYKIIQ